MYVQRKPNGIFKVSLRQRPSSQARWQSVHKEPGLLSTDKPSKKTTDSSQSSRAIITKYKHLRDYVEKVQKPTFMEYELAATYTGK